MSAVLRLTPKDARNLAEALRRLTEMTADTGVRIDAHTGAHLHVNDAAIRVRWDDEEAEYVIDDRIGE